MKKILLSGLILGSMISQVGASNLPVKLYGGAGLVGSFLGSKFKMNYSSNVAANPYAESRENHLGRVGGEIFLGVGSKDNNELFWSTEVSYNFSRADHEHDFYNDQNSDGETKNGGNGRISYIDVNHGFELGLSLRLGRKLNAYDVYGILGLTNKKVEFKYGLDSAHSEVKVPIEINPSKRVTGVLVGVGVSKNFSHNISCGLEYKYKTYGNVKKDIDFRAESDAALSVGHDTSGRTFKDRSDKHEVALRVSIGV